LRVGSEAPSRRSGVGRAPPYLLAAGSLTLAMGGDSLVYVVIPAAAAAYGLGPVGVSLVLSVNRFVRLALNPLVARWLIRVGSRRGTVVGVALAVASTAAYALAPGLAALLVARVVWGASFATLRLTMFGYATAEPDRAPRRLGLAVGIQEVAPAVLLVVGASLLGLLGPRWLFAGLAALSLLALPLALALPRGSRGEETPVPPVPERGAAVADAPLSPAPAPAAATAASPPVPARGVWRAAFATSTVGFGVDGVLGAGVVLTLLAFGEPAGSAVSLGAAVLAARKVAQVLVSPAAGWLAQRAGVTLTVALGMLGSAVGLAAVAAGAVVTGSLTAVVSAAAVAALTPAAVRSDTSAARMRGLGWLTTARDLGGASGAAFAPLALVGAAAADTVAWTFGAAAGAVVVAGITWVVTAPRVARRAPT
jgi:hypothetical protein